MPTPNKGESKDDYMSRCMGDNKMNDDFGNPKQRAAVCNSYYEKKDAKAKMEDYLFRTPEGARKKSQEIGFDGEIHESTLADGTKLYSPAKTEEEFITWYRKNDPDAEQELSALQYGRPGKNDPRKTPAKPSERRKGSKKNKPGSAKKPNKSISMSKETENRLKSMMREHNAKVAKKGKGSKASLGRLKSVFRRGAGAFSRSHAPNMSRTGWGIARVKAFLYLLRNGRPSNPNYKQDNDLLPKSHPRSASEGEDYEDWDNEVFEGAEYKGRKVKLNKPFRTPKERRKFAVYVQNANGKVIIVRFGDPNMEIKRDDPERRKNFRSRHKCDTAKDKTTPRYWSCKMWERGKSVTDYTSSEFNKTDDSLETFMGGCGCDNNCGSVEAEMVEKDMFDNPGEATNRAKELGCEGIHSLDRNGKTLFMPCNTHGEYEKKMNGDKEVDVEGYGGGGGGYSYSKPKVKKDGCREGYEKRGGECVKMAWTLDLDISVDEAIIEASTGKEVIRISGVAFHQGVNKNGWEITRAGANVAVPQMIGADLTLNHPPSENGRFRRNMDGGVNDAVVGIVTEAQTIDKTGGEWEVRFKADVYRSELFESLESGLWLRKGYGVSIGGTGIPDEMIEAEDGKTIMVFESEFEFDHLAIVHKPAYAGANIETVERVKLAESSEVFNSDTHNGLNQQKVNIMTEEEIIEVEATEEVVETPIAEEEVVEPNHSAELEALKASLAEKEAELNAIKAAEEAKAEEARLALVEKATELGIAGVSDLPSETIESIIASFEAKITTEEVVEMKPVEASEASPVESKPSSTSVVSNWLNQRRLNTPEEIYEKAWNVWAKSWNQFESTHKAPLYAEIKEKI